jgi:glycosyltransferase involved in cell wall biosynthesis
MDRSWLFVGPVLLAGIGQVTKKYADLMESEYVVFGQRAKLTYYDNVFIFALPVDQQLDMIKHYYSVLTPNLIIMTVCETDTVHPSYGKLLDISDTIYCPSEFSRNVLATQFPKGNFKLLHHWTPEVPIVNPTCTRPYVFYTIGNIADPRKNIQMLIKAFRECRFPSAKLVLKATCKDEINIDDPNITIINGLLSDDELNKLHGECHCYVNCSHSEGVGMGAVEAAMRNKPVIIPEYGGLGEYVKTPYIIKCGKKSIGFNDFLYTPELVWGDPDFLSLKDHMMNCYFHHVYTQDHSATRQLMSMVKVHIAALGKAPVPKTEQRL